MSTPPSPLALRGIAKRFGSVQALHGADFVLAAGEVHALLGENGAGKTTLMRVADGLVRPDAGAVLVDGVARALRSPRDARRLGIGMVHQHSTAIPSLTVAENVALAAGWPVRPAELRRRFGALVARTGLALEPDTYAGRLSVSLKQRLEILKVLAAEARVLLLDEPTAVLAPAEVGELLSMVRAFAAGGGSVVLITHKLDEALAVAGRVTVLRHGRVTLESAAAETTPARLLEAMLGRDGGTAERREVAPVQGEPPVRPALVVADHLDLPRESGYGVVLRDGSLVVRAGEIVGVAAVEGNGQRELLRAVAGLVQPLRGRLEVAQPVAFIPEDRTTEGLIPELSLAENVTLGLGDRAAWVHGTRLRRIDWRAARRRTAELIRQFGVRAAGPTAPAASLSGGNQQRIVVARALELAPRVIVAENPTRGLDVAAAREVHERLRAAAAAGAAVLVHASDLDEVLALATRVLVVAGGAILAPGPAPTRATVGALMLRGRASS
ncbi:MAG TPA: ATP-binding cassette domain-containing protein [Gemmatimonadales bacterium]|nr:ATP-binding cassette domain-containing protein [Gemmatimonadales bacterium]